MVPQLFEENIILRSGLSTISAESKRHNFTIKVTKDEDGFFVGRNDEMGVVSQGKTLEELEINIIDAIETAIEVDQDDQHKEFSITFQKSI